MGLQAMAIALENVAAVVFCGGEHPEAVPYLVENFESHRDYCKPWEYMPILRFFDAMAFLGLLSLILMINAYMFINVRGRREVIVREQLRLNASPAPGKEFSGEFDREDKFMQ